MCWQRAQLTQNCIVCCQYYAQCVRLERKEDHTMFWIARPRINCCSVITASSFASSICTRQQNNLSQPGSFQWTRRKRQRKNHLLDFHSRLTHGLQFLYSLKGKKTPTSFLDWRMLSKPAWNIQSQPFRGDGWTACVCTVGCSICVKLAVSTLFCFFMVSRQSHRVEPGYLFSFLDMGTDQTAHPKKGLEIGDWAW